MISQKRSRNESKLQINNFLSQLYLDPETHSNSTEGLYQNAIRNNFNHLTFTKEDVRGFLASQKSFNVFQAKLLLLSESIFEIRISLCDGMTGFKF
jgi:hypothetical protein